MRSNKGIRSAIFGDRRMSASPLFRNASLLRSIAESENSVFSKNERFAVSRKAECESEIEFLRRENAELKAKLDALVRSDQTSIESQFAELQKKKSELIERRKTALARLGESVYRIQLLSERLCRADAERIAERLLLRHANPSQPLFAELQRVRQLREEQCARLADVEEPLLRARRAAADAARRALEARCQTAETDLKL